MKTLLAFLFLSASVALLALIVVWTSRFARARFPHLTAAMEARVVDPGHLATTNQRVGAWLLDAFLGSLYFAPFVIAMRSVGTFNDQEFDLAAFFGFWIPAYLSLFALMVYFDGSPRGQTPGKLIVGIRVGDEKDGTPIGYGRAFKRRLVYLAGGLALYVGWLWCLWDRRRQTWHDKAAGSLVVRARNE